jgi:hypothetical protein
MKKIFFGIVFYLGFRFRSRDSARFNGGVEELVVVF